MSSVTISSLSLTYPDGTVGLEGIDLAIANGEFIALVGPSGSGKTTLLRSIAGFLAPTSGSITIGDTVVADAKTLVAPEKRGLGMVFQQHAIWPHWDVARNVGYPLKLAGVSRTDRAKRVAEVLETVGLAGYEKRNPSTLSGGQRQRVALARAIVGRPSVLLLDEALSALDEPLRDALRLELQTLTRSIGLTVVHVTHDRDEALALADRVVVLDAGRILQIGAPPELVTRPASAAVARFLSDATLFPGELSTAGFTATDHPCSVDAAAIETSTGPAVSAGTLAVLPEDVQLRPAQESAGSAVVTSSLFGRSGNDVVVDWRGVAVRCRVASYRPLVGENVAISIGRALFFADESELGDVGAPHGSSTTRVF
ncbi:MAG: putative transporter ATP-binding protein [Glaciihabitans sp.]|nr:putative transporter ATP-binding protein [Glaciihabitans sp.]